MSVRRPQPSSTSAFTLVELLLVCIVMAALAAIVAPTMGSSAQRAHLDGTARAIVAFARAARARASAEGRAYYLCVDGERKEVRLARARDPLVASGANTTSGAGDATIETDAETDGQDWVNGAPWARPIAFEDGVTLVWARVATQAFQGTGGMPPVTTFSGGVNTTTSSLFGTVQAQQDTVGTTANNTTTGGFTANATNPNGATPIPYPRVAFDADGSADDAFFDLEAGEDRVRIVVEAASGRTRILTASEYEASLRGDLLPLPTDAPR